MADIDLGVVSGAAWPRPVIGCLARFLEVHLLELVSVELRSLGDSDDSYPCFSQRVVIDEESLPEKLRVEVKQAERQLRSLLEQQFSPEQCSIFPCFETAYDIDLATAWQLVEDRLGSLPPGVRVWTAPLASDDITATFGFGNQMVFLAVDTKILAARQYLAHAQQVEDMTSSDIGLD